MNSIELINSYPIEKLTKINPKHTSYSYKQHAEEYSGDKVSNGAFIVAAICAGFKKRVDEFNPNVWFNINERSLVRLLNSKQPGSTVPANNFLSCKKSLNS